MSNEPKLCKDCKHYSYAFGHHMCAAPPHKFNMIDGMRQNEFADLRRRHGPCGASAQMFMARSPSPGTWVEQHIHPQPRSWWEFWK